MTLETADGKSQQQSLWIRKQLVWAPNGPKRTYLPFKNSHLIQLHDSKI